MEIWKKMWVGVFFWTQCICWLNAFQFTPIDTANMFALGKVCFLTLDSPSACWKLVSAYRQELKRYKSSRLQQRKCMEQIHNGCREARDGHTDGEIGITVGDLNLSCLNEFINGDDPSSGRHHSAMTRSTLCNTSIHSLTNASHRHVSKQLQ